MAPNLSSQHGREPVKFTKTQENFLAWLYSSDRESQKPTAHLDFRAITDTAKMLTVSTISPEVYAQHSNEERNALQLTTLYYVATRESRSKFLENLTLEEALQIKIATLAMQKSESYHDILDIALVRKLAAYLVSPAILASVRKPTEQKYYEPEQIKVAIALLIEYGRKTFGQQGEIVESRYNSAFRMPAQDFQTIRKLLLWEGDPLHLTQVNTFSGQLYNRVNADFNAKLSSK